MQIPESLITELKDRIIEDFCDIYIEHISTPSSHHTDFDSFIYDIFEEIENEVENLIEVTNEMVYTYIRRRVTTKNRWVKKELEKEENFYREIVVAAKSIFEDTLNRDAEKFYSIYGCHSHDELVEKTIQELQEWASDHSQHVSQFRYIKYKTEKQILTGMQNDIKYLIYNEMFTKMPRGKQSAISSLPFSMSHLPIDFTGKVKIDSNEVEKIEQKNYFVDKYHIDDTTILESRLNVEILKTGVLNSVLKTLNTTDISVFLYCMSLRDDKFYSTREIVVEIGDIVN